MVAGSSPAGRAIWQGCVVEKHVVVGVAQLVEHRIVTPVVVGSIPIVHPIFQMTPDSRFGVVILGFWSADVVELVDTPDLGSGAARCESSSLSVRTIQIYPA